MVEESRHKVLDREWALPHWEEEGSLAAIFGVCRDGMGMDGEELKMVCRFESHFEALHLM